MKFLTAARQLWYQIFSGTWSSPNGHAVDSRGNEPNRVEALRDPDAASNQIRISVDAAKYLGRLSPGLYEEVVSICRVDAARQNNLITREMVQNVVDAIFRHGNTSQAGGTVHVGRQAG